MKHTYKITGMTCEGCKASVAGALNSVEQVQDVQVDLLAGKAEITMDSHVDLIEFQKALSSKYTISDIEETNVFASSNTVDDSEEKKTKLQQLQPLFLIFGYILAAVIFLNYMSWNIADMMLDFMGLFFIVFSFFKVLDLKGFPESFRMYDPLAKLLPLYGWIYPFIEIALGLMFLMRYEVGIALIVTIVILGITSVGVTRTLLNKKAITCACLGTTLKLPMTEATFIENAIMILMALFMSFKNYAI